MEKIVSPDTLTRHEALLIDSHWQRFCDQQLTSLLPTGTSLHRGKAQLASGELVVLTDSPQAPLYLLNNGQLEANSSSHFTSPAEAVSVINRRFLNSTGSAGGVTRITTDNLPPPPELAYTPEPVPVSRPPEPQPPLVTIADTFGQPPIGAQVPKPKTGTDLFFRPVLAKFDPHPGRAKAIS